jgi:hypothetical protein
MFQMVMVVGLDGERTISHIRALWAGLPQQWSRSKAVNPCIFYGSRYSNLLIQEYKRLSISELLSSTANRSELVKERDSAVDFAMELQDLYFIIDSGCAGNSEHSGNDVPE